MTVKAPGMQFDVGGGEPLKLEGWDGLSSEAAENMQEAQFQTQLDRASLYRIAFTTEAGRQVLQDMISCYLGKRIVDPIENSARADGIRQGHCDVVGEILYLIEFANTGGGRPTVESPESEE